MMMMINMYEIISFQVSKKRLISVNFSFGSCYCQQSKLTLIHKFPDNAISFKNVKKWEHLLYFQQHAEDLDYGYKSLSGQKSMEKTWK